jgi:hypothetical protein
MSQYVFSGEGCYPLCDNREKLWKDKEKDKSYSLGYWEEKSGLKLVYATLIRASRRWFHEVKFTIFDINYLDKLRKELNIDNKKYENTTIKEEILWGITFYKGKKTWPIPNLAILYIYY